MSQRRPRALAPGRPSADSEFPPEDAGTSGEGGGSTSAAGVSGPRPRRFHVSPNYFRLHDETAGLTVTVAAHLHSGSASETIWRLAPELAHSSQAERGGVTIARGSACSPGRALGLAAFAALSLKAAGFPDDETLVASDPRNLVWGSEQFIRDHPSIPAPALGELLRLMAANEVEVSDEVVGLACSTFSTGRVG